MSDFAFFQIEPALFLVGTGPFEARAVPPDLKTGVSAFYLNDFALSDPKPWKVPASLRMVDNLSTCPGIIEPGGHPSIEWEDLDCAVFQQVFDEIQEKIGAGLIEKSVPVITERGHLVRGTPTAVIHSFEHLNENLWAYGWQLGSRGMVGATPEQLFQIGDGRLETMALAGTASIREAGDFPDDKKEIREHQFVDQFLTENLLPLGDLHRGKREVVNFGSLVHFLTRINVRLADPNPDLDALIRLMHPTPALGAFPSNGGALNELHANRRQLQVPDCFGAPFGVSWENRFRAVVAIRGVSWEGRRISLPSGCGVIKESRFLREWQEMALKRDSVKTQFGI